MSGLIMLAVILGVVVALLEFTHRRHQSELPLAGLGMNDRDAVRARDELRIRWHYGSSPLG